MPILYWEADQEDNYIYEIEIDSDGGDFTSPIATSTGNFSGTSTNWVASDCNYCCPIYSDISWNTTYDWRVKNKG